MVQYAMRIGLGGGAFFMLMMWESYRSRKSYSQFLHEKENPGEGKVSMVDYYQERRQLLGEPKKYLNVDNFSLENLEGVKAPKNSLQ